MWVMPLIHVLNASPRDDETKRQLIAELTETYARVMRMKPDTIRVIIQELPRENWGVGGVTLADSGQDESLPG
jgi:4-oxalocrotonate tautomerase